MSLDRQSASIARVRQKTSALVLVCNSCAGGSHVRRNLRRVVRAGELGDVRVVRCGCLDICPKRGAAALLTLAGSPSRCVVIATDATGEDLARQLGDERVRDPVSHQDRRPADDLERRD